MCAAQRERHHTVAKVFIMGTDIHCERAVMERLRCLAGTPAITMDACNDLASCDLLIVYRNSPLRRAVDRIVRDRPALPLWLLDHNGSLADGTRPAEAPLSEDAIRCTLRRIMQLPAEAANDRFADAPNPGDEAHVTGQAQLAAELNRRAIARTGAAALVLDDHPLALLDFAAAVAVPGIDTGGAPERLEIALAEAFDRVVLQPLPADHVVAPGMEDSSSIPLPRLLWRTGLQFDQHALLPAAAMMRLPAWPDFRIIARQHDHFRLCSLLLRRACTTATAAELLELPLADVQGFFNAAWISGYGELAQPPAAPAHAANTPRRGAGSLLASMWRRVRGRRVD